MALSKNFKPAMWRGTTGTDGEVIGVSFDLPHGETIRLALNANCARQLSVSIAEAFEQRGTDFQTNREAA